MNESISGVRGRSKEEVSREVRGSQESEQVES